MVIFFIIQLFLYSILINFIMVNARRMTQLWRNPLPLKGIPNSHAGWLSMCVKSQCGKVYICFTRFISKEATICRHCIHKKYIYKNTDKMCMTELIWRTCLVSWAREDYQALMLVTQRLPFYSHYILIQHWQSKLRHYTRSLVLCVQYFCWRVWFGGNGSFQFAGISYSYITFNTNNDKKI